jgi:hypothetical protein
MALVLKDRVKETSTAPGTGSFILNGAVNGFQSFAAIGNGNTTYYAAQVDGGSDWEVGIGTYASGVFPILIRNTILASSNAGSPVNFTASSVVVFVTYPAERGVWVGAPSAWAIDISGTATTATNIDDGTY